MAKYRVVHYINQFYAGIGGEEFAGTEPFKKAEIVGPGLAFAGALGEEVEIVGTVVCGDSYFGENMLVAEAEVLEMIQSFNPDLVIAGPAFNAGRYGVACGAVAQRVTQQLQIPVVTGMYEENPGVDLYKKDAYIVSVGKSAVAMRKAVPLMASLAEKLLKGESVDPTEDHYIVRHRTNFEAEERGAARAVKMLIKKLNDQAFQTEFPMPEFDNVEPGKAITKMAQTKVALVTSGGIVPKGNPDHIESSSASKYGEYDITGVMDLTEATYETAHGGYDPMYANQDADRVLPVDVMRDFEKEGRIGALHTKFYTTTGNGTSVANAKSFAAEFAQKLISDGVQAVILTST